MAPDGRPMSFSLESHCEEQSDVAIRNTPLGDEFSRLLRSLRMTGNIMTLHGRQGLLLKREL